MPERALPEETSPRVTRSADHHVVIQGLSKTYDSPRGAVRALDVVDLSVRSEEFLAVLGPSGCGKSTLLLLVAGLIPPTSGSIAIAGEPIAGAHTDLGIVFQQDTLLEWRTVLRNVMLQCEIRKLASSSYRPRALELLERAGLRGFEGKYPYELSGGMRQRVAICRALIHSPPLLLMDEPFGALDALTREQMSLDLLRIQEGSHSTVIFITHSISEAVLLSDRIVLMSPRPGRIVEVIPIDLPKPRTGSMAERADFAEHIRYIRHRLVEEGVLKE